MVHYCTERLNWVPRDCIGMLYDPRMAETDPVCSCHLHRDVTGVYRSAAYQKLLEGLQGTWCKLNVNDIPWGIQ